MTFRKYVMIISAVLAALMLFSACSKNTADSPESTVITTQPTTIDNQIVDTLIKEQDLQELFGEVHFLIPEFESLETVSDDIIKSALKGYYSSASSYNFDDLLEEDGNEYAVAASESVEAVIENMLYGVTIPQPTKAEDGTFWFEGGKYYILRSDPGELLYKYTSSTANEDGTVIVLLEKATGENAVERVNIVMASDEDGTYHMSSVYYG